MPEGKSRKQSDIVGKIDLVEKKGLEMPVVIYDKWCKGCGICVEFCPKGVLKFDRERGNALVAFPARCIHCGQCELRCPDFAITRVKREAENGKKKK